MFKRILAIAIAMHVLAIIGFCEYSSNLQQMKNEKSHIVIIKDKKATAQIIVPKGAAPSIQKAA